MILLKFILGMPKIVRFLFTGCLNTLVGFIFFSLALYISDGNIWFSLATNIGVGIFFNYLSYGFGVFKCSGKSQFAKFVLAYAFMYLLNYIVLKFMLGFQVDIYIAQLINLFYLAPLSYFILNKLVFVPQADPRFQQ